MQPQGPPTPLAGAQQVSPALLRSNSGFMGGQGGGISSQNAFPSLVSPRNQINNMSMLGNVPNIPSLLHQPFGNGVPSSGHSGPGSSQRGIIDGGTESDPLTNVGNGMEFNPRSSSYLSSSIATNSNFSGQVQGRQQFSSPSGSQMLTDQQQAQQPDPQSFQQNSQSMQQFSVPNNPQQQSQSQQQQFQAMRSGLAGIGSVKLEPQMTSEEPPPPHLQALRNLGTVKLEPQQLQSMRSLGPVKMEPQHSETSMFLQQQQQQQLLLSRQSSQAAAAAQILQQQRLMQIQHQQQQQLLKSMPQQRSPMQSQFPSQSIPFRSPVKSVYEPGMCARRLTHYMYQQQHRPDDNNIEFWRKFVAEYFAPNAKKKWCVSMYGNGRQTTGVFPQDVWQCEICNRRPGRGFEATAEVLPRLFKIKYESGIVEELLYVDMPREYQNSSGQIVLDYAKAIQESVFEQLRVVRDGQLRVVFSPDLKICSWEFCARRHEELIPRRLLIPQVSQLGNAAQKYQAATQNASSNMSVSELQNNCNMFVASARQLAKALEVPLVNDLGYTKRYVRCLQISEVVNSMKDLIDYSRETGTGPMDSLAKFPRRTNPSTGFQGQSQQPEGQLLQQLQRPGQNSNNDNAVQAASMQLASNGMPNMNNTNSVPATSTTGTSVALLHQNSINSRQQNSSSANGPYGGSGVQIPSPGASSSMPQTQPPSSSFQSHTPSSSNNARSTPHGSLLGAPVSSSVSSPNVSMQQPALSGDTDANDSQSSVQKIIHDMLMSSQLSGGGMMGMGTMGGNVKNVNGMLPSNNTSINGNHILLGNGLANGNPNIGSSGFGISGNRLGQSPVVNGIRAPAGNNSLSINGRVSLAMARDLSTNQQQQQQQQDVGNQLLGGLGAVNNFSNLQFDWKGSP
ncbi:transcriptional corepressor SEUSS-like isoform X1 [Primulina huaijiensis]|uniref:transcriptional corepressor SEUSS-like isoform X1 n=1 Tax=Primulina huaijiensis TaxID=1492673 RepID=UPI003CC78D6B